MSKIKSLPILERPREKAIRYGVETLSDIELLAILLGSGYQGENVVELSTRLLFKYGGLRRLSNIPFSELKNNKGIKDAKALNLSAIFEFNRRLSFKQIEEDDAIIDEEYLYNKYLPLIGQSQQEQMVVVVLSRCKRILHETILYKGNENGVHYSLPEIIKSVMSYGGRYFYLIHNHPSGDYEPSQLDKIGTSYLFIKSKEMKYPMLDHIIISPSGYYSFKKMKKT